MNPWEVEVRMDWILFVTLAFGSRVPCFGDRVGDRFLVRMEGAPTQISGSGC